MPSVWRMIMAAEVMYETKSARIPITVYRVIWWGGREGMRGVAGAGGEGGGEEGVGWGGVECGGEGRCLEAGVGEG